MWSEATMTRSSMAADEYSTSTSWYSRHRDSPHFKKKKKATSCMSSGSMSRDGKGRREKEAREDTDTFLDLLSKVQGAQYDNQRCTLPPKVAPRPPRTNTNGDIPVNIQGDFPTSSIPTLLRPNNNGSTSLGLPGAQQQTAQAGSVPFRKSKSSSPSPSPSPSSSTPSFTLSAAQPVQDTGSTVTPSRKSMDALREVVAKEGPYPLVISAPGGGFWVENGDYEGARAKNGFIWAPEISTEHLKVDSDPTMFAYTRHFLAKDHRNYVGRDGKVGGLLLSILFDEDQTNKTASIRMLYRTHKESIHRLVPTTQLSEQQDPEHYMKYMAQFTSDKNVNPEGVTRIMYPKVYELFQKFDEHTYVKGHKIGVVYQKFKQVSEEEMFSNVETPKAFEEFLNMIGKKVKLKGFEGFRGGLDTVNDQTGEYSYYTTHKDKEIMFHVSTLLPYNATDSQQVQRKRHIGNDIVVLVFQDKNTTFCPGIIRSHFIHSYIVVQVEYPNTDHVVYKVAVAAKNDVGQFDPPLPHPTVFQKGPEFREWLLTKLLNAEVSCHRAPDFQKLATRTRTQLFNQLVDEVTHYRDDIDGVNSDKRAKSITLSDRHSGLSLSPSQQRRKASLGGLFGTRDSLTLGGIVSKRKSIGGRMTGGEGLSPKTFRPLRENDPMTMIGSTPDLAIPSTSHQGYGHHDRSTTSGSSADEHHVGEELPVGDMPPNSQNNKKVKRRFTFKKDRKKPKGTQDIIEEPSEHPRAFREAFNSSPSPNKMDGQNSENSSLASNSALRLSVPSDLHNLNHSNSASAENISEFEASCTTSSSIIVEGRSKLRESVSSEFESQEARVPYQVEAEGVDDGEEGWRGWSRDSQPRVEQSQVTVEISSNDVGSGGGGGGGDGGGGDGGGGDSGILSSGVVGDIIRPKERGGDRGQQEASSSSTTPLGVENAIRSEDLPHSTAVFTFPSPVHSAVVTVAESLNDTLSPDLPTSAKNPLTPPKTEASVTSSPDHHSVSPSSSSSSSSSMPTKTKTVTITRRISESHALRKLPTQKDILSRYGRASVSSDMGGAATLREVKEAGGAHARSSSDLALPTREDSYVSTPALSATPTLPPEVPRPVTSLGFALSSSSSPKASNGKAPKVLDEEEVLKTCSTESLISAIENSHEALLVQTLIGEVTKLQEQNTKLWKENARLTTMNKVMVAKYKGLKQQLEDSTHLISELKKFRPEFV
eukprot:Em0008g909a